MPANAGVLACTWTARPTGRHRLVPDTCLDLVCLFDRRRDDVRMLLCGPERAAWTFELPEGTTAVGVRFRPGCAAACLDIDVSTLLDRRVPFDRVIGRAAADEVASALLAVSTLDDRADALERSLSPTLRGVRDDALAFVDLTTDLLVRSPQVAQSELASAVGVTPRQLHRRLLRTFGYGTSTLGRLLRFHRFLSVREVSGGVGSLSALAATAGYADQAHLARDCRAITGLTVRQFLVEWFPTFPDMSDPFKTSTPLATTMAR